MVRSPCLACELVDKDKRNTTCDACKKRKQYVAGLGGTTASVPVDLTDIGGAMRNTWTEADVQFLKDNIDKMSNKALGVKLGRSESAVANRLSILNIKRNGDFRRGVVWDPLLKRALN